MPHMLYPESQPPHMLWVDCEFTGLPLEDGHKIIEIGALVTNSALEEIDDYQDFVYYDWPFIKAQMSKNPWWNDRDADRQRMRDGNVRARPALEVDLSLAGLTCEYFGDDRPSLYGNSLRGDMNHIDAQFPNFASLLIYRVVDVNSVGILTARYRSVAYAKKQHKHYALDDIRESVDQLRFLLKQTGIADVAQLAIGGSAEAAEG
jgi:oligoribonuclease (3'-5' exoribonuclease)